MNILAFIPARGNSKSIPRKNLKLLGGKPLISYSVESAFKAGLDKVIISTEDDEISKVAYSLGAEILKRPESLAKDTTSMFELLKSEILKIEPKPDLVLLLQPTSPLRKSIHIKTAISYLTENLDKYDSIISVEKVPEKYSPYAMIIEKKVLFRKLINWKEKIISWFTGKKYVFNLSGFPISQRMTRRQDLEQCYLPDGSIYCFKTSNLKGGSIYGRETMLLENEGSLNLNEPSDWELAEKLIKEKNER